MLANTNEGGGINSELKLHNLWWFTSSNCGNIRANLNQLSCVALMIANQILTIRQVIEFVKILIFLWNQILNKQIFDLIFQIFIQTYYSEWHKTRTLITMTILPLSSCDVAGQFFIDCFIHIRLILLYDEEIFIWCQKYVQVLFKFSVDIWILNM